MTNRVVWKRWLSKLGTQLGYLFGYLKQGKSEEKADEKVDSDGEERVEKKVSGSESSDEAEKEREVMLGWKRVLVGLAEDGRLEQMLNDAKDPAVNPWINAAVSGT